MIYYVTGLNSRAVKIEEIMKEFTDIKVYDAYIKEEYEQFIESITNQSLFSTNELIILKRAEKIKSMKELISFLAKFNDDNKSIIVDYFCEYKNKNPYLKDFEKMNANIINIEDSKQLIENYIQENLKISKKDMQDLIELIGTDYNHVKNEIYKYNTVINGEFSFDKVKDLISISSDKKIFDIVDDIMYKNTKFNDIPTNLYMPIIYSLYKEFEILHKLHNLKLSLDYNKFKDEFNEYKEIFPMSYYPIYLRNKKIINFSKKSCFKILLDLNKYETMIKQGKIDDKLAFWYIFESIRKERK
ncbi:DNA polymerase III subunit delta [Oceanivirga salmonicida]|uniref:hypothetical protein n=2 Tax=Oceanivirga salmonicida TaxID=1769291 RepID=UPI0012E1A854|nr:hypothetical protein [Oceanivirga salmonicida]